MMVKMINVLGNEMFVEKSRVDEYLAYGHKLATEPKKTEKSIEVPKPTTAKKSMRKTRK